ncbi:lipoyl(octanoyl) transferase LipB [Kozakia baliensis]|uniref:Octanoyltransferase n=1 Tax=Kozakia baliensis TaxID=153496 RepID=A0A1D8UU75_9PROT|nr:lipoyl(octanoyl) transferase LipB [Kozakia baliensis]AOX17047.1 lipoate-protein ligase B [Kozakia baliensis]GBR25085.1 lipoate-protein ligase B [Kozakia baliensis NRIC 0488]GEL63894.1 octanoyltransferase [Kozakia baliensis]
MHEPRAIVSDEIYDKILWEKSEKLIPYPEAIHFMEERKHAIRAESAAELLWFLEHPAVFTAGTSARDEDLINPHGFDTYNAGRGGQWTYHGPRQRVVYLMLDLQRPHGPTPPRDLRAFVQSLEQWIIASLMQLGIKGEVREGRVGVWVIDPPTGREAKIAALGIRISRWVSWHGVSINFNPDLSHFDGIVPCGIREFGVTSIQRFNPDLTMADLDAALLENWPTFFGAQPVFNQPSGGEKVPAGKTVPS